LDQISEYLQGWSEENSSETNGNKDLVNPSTTELELFNITSGIPRQRVSKK
jgi:hypothetical protein